MGSPSPNNENKVWAWVRFDPSKIGLDRILKVMGTGLVAKPAPPLVQIEGESRDPRIRTYRSTDSRIRVTKDTQIHVEVIPEPGVSLAEFTITGQEYQRLAFVDRLSEAREIAIPVGDSRWLEVSYRHQKARTTQVIRLEVPLG